MLYEVLAILGVVAIHSTGIGYTFNDSSIDFNVTAFWRQLINFSVPMFIAVSGFFLANNKVDTKESYLNFITKQIPRVLIPYLLWSILYLGFAYFKGASILDLTFRLFTFSSSTPFYFIILIIEYYLLLPFLQRLATPKGLTFSALVSFICCLVIFYLRYYTNLPLPLILVGSAPSWLIFFVLGIYVKNNTINIKNKSLILFLLVGFVLSLLETYLLYNKFNEIGNAVTAVKVSSFMYSSFVILFAFKNADKGYLKSKYLIYIGKISFGVFLSHMFFMSGIRPILNKMLPFLKENAILYQTSLICSTLICCIIFAIVTRKINESYAVKYLGQ